MIFIKQLLQNLLAEFKRRREFKAKLEALTDPTFLDRAIKGEHDLH